MGYVYAEIELVNAGDVVLARRHIIGEEEIKQIKVTMLVDSGSYLLCINENIQEYLQIPVTGKREFELANGHFIMCDIVSPIDVHFKNRSTTCRAIVLPGDSEPLMGAVPMKDLDVIIHPLRQELMVNPESPDIQRTSSHTLIPKGKRAPYSKPFNPNDLGK